MRGTGRLMGRKLALNDDGWEELCAALSESMTVTGACDLVGIGTSTFYEYVKRGMAGEQPFSGWVLKLRRDWAKGTQQLLQLAKQQAADDPGQVRYLLGIRNPEAYGKDARRAHFIQEALDAGATREEQVNMMANHPDVRAAVLASLTAEECAVIKPPKKAKALPRGKAKR